MEPLSTDTLFSEFNDRGSEDEHHKSGNDHGGDDHLADRDVEIPDLENEVTYNFENFSKN